MRRVEARGEGEKDPNGKETEGSGKERGDPGGPRGALGGGTVGRGAGTLEAPQGTRRAGVEGGLGGARAPERRERAAGRERKLLCPAYRDLKRPHPAVVPSGWSHRLSWTWLPSVSPTAPRPHIYEAQLIMHQARLLVPAAPTCSPALSGRGGSGQLSAAHLPPSAVPCPLPHPHTHPLHGPFTGAEAMSAGSLRRGAAQTTRDSVMETGTFPEKYSVWPPSCIEELSGA